MDITRKLDIYLNKSEKSITFFMKMSVTYDGFTYEVNRDGELKSISRLSDISHIEGLESLTNLKKLEITGNGITKIN